MDTQLKLHLEKVDFAEMRSPATKQFIPPKMPEGYYNTVGETGDNLQAYKEKARKQNEMILEFFQNHSFGMYTPFEVQQYLNLYMSPTTSIRRSMTDLTHAGYLIKTDTRKMERFGRGNFCWKLKR